MKIALAVVTSLAVLWGAEHGAAQTVTYTVKTPILMNAASAVVQGMAMAFAMKAEKEKIARDLAQSRQSYWREYPSGPGLEAARNAYGEALLKKDMYLYDIYVRDAMMRAAKLAHLMPSGGAAAIDGFEGATGFIEPPHPLARAEFDRWAETLMSARLHNPSNDAGLAAAMPAYVAYATRRDLAEYLFANPKSPLLQDDDPVAYCAAFFLAIESVKTNEAAAALVAKLNPEANREPLRRAVHILRSYQSIEDFRLAGPNMISDEVVLLQHLVALQKGEPVSPPPRMFTFFDPQRSFTAVDLDLNNEDVGSTSSMPGARSRQGSWVQRERASLDEIKRMMAESQKEVDEAKAAEALRRYDAMRDRMAKARASSELLKAVDTERIPVRVNLSQLQALSLWAGRMHQADPAPPPVSSASVSPQPNGRQIAPGAAPRPATPPPAPAAPARQVASIAPRPAPAQTTPAVTPTVPAARQAEVAPAPASSALGELQRQFESLSSRSAQAKSDVAQFEQRMSAQGLRLRADVQDARSRVDGLLRASSDAIQSGDAAKAEENMRYADNAVRTMEKFLGR